MEEKTTKAIIQPKEELPTKEPIILTPQEVKDLICPKATEKEIAIFLRKCKKLCLDPLIDEINLIKYSESDKAAYVIAIDAYLKAAEVNPHYDGHEAGIVLKNASGKLEYREGAILLEEEKENLVGGWAKVYRKNLQRPVFVAVNKSECIKYTKDKVTGEEKPTSFWTEEKQPSMLRKVALKRALFETFPNLFAGTISTAEFKEIEVSEEKKELPPPVEEKLPAFTKNGKPDWSKFWVSLKERGISTTGEAHQLLGVNSIKAEVEKGKTLEEVFEMVLARKREEEEKKGKGESEQAKLLNP